MITPENRIYNGGIVTGSLLMEESRKIAQLDPPGGNMERFNKSKVKTGSIQNVGRSQIY